ncbi:MAG: hypothetical protein JJT94_13340 [Bernardetiaceae bacterium]|nr:hypothetical protein [Bernardetiaceae bacterium]
MRLSEFKTALSQVQQLHFELPSGELVPAHFHITEAGLLTKHFIDCGGTVRKEKRATFQLWSANDTDHRLAADKLLKIIDIAQPLFEEEDPEIEIEYQQESINKYGLTTKGAHFSLTPLQTDCLAKEKCGIPPQPKKKMKISDLQNQQACAPGGGCC